MSAIIVNLPNVQWKACGRVLTERLMEVTEGKFSDEQRGFRTGKGYLDQILSVEMLVEEYSRKVVCMR